MNNVMQQNENGSWTPAIPEPYYPSKWELLKCIFGRHTYVYGQKEAWKAAQGKHPYGRVDCLVCHSELQ